MAAAGWRPGDTQLEALLFPSPPDVPSDPALECPDCVRGASRSASAEAVTLALLWEEYDVRRQPTGSATRDMLRPYLCYAPQVAFGRTRSRGVLLTQHNLVLLLADLHVPWRFAMHQRLCEKFSSWGETIQHQTNCGDVQQCF